MDRRIRSFDGSDGGKPRQQRTEPKSVQEVFQDPQLVSVILSLVFSLGVFIYFFYKLMHGIREDYRKGRKLKLEAERRAALGIESSSDDDDDENEEEEKQGKNDREVQLRKAIAAKKSRTSNKTKDSDDDDQNQKKAVDKKEEKKKEGEETMRKRKSKASKDV